MKKICPLLPLVAALMLTAACTGGKTPASAEAEEPDEEPLPERYESDDLPMAAEELFDDFVYYFASNEELQRRRIVFPLEVTRGGEKTMLDSAEWQMEPLFRTTDGYALIFDDASQRDLAGDTTVSEAVVERILFAADSVSQYVFRRTDGRWHMTAMRHQALAENANAAFLTFYGRFASDSTFQQQSLCKEILFTSADPDDDFAEMEGFITPDSWEAFAPELPRDTIYNIVYSTPDARSRQKLFVICGIANGMEIELTFRKERGRWKLAKLTE